MKCAEFFKKVGVTTVLIAVAAILSLVGTIIFIISNVVDGYAIDNGGFGITIGFLSFLLVCGAVYSSHQFGSQHCVTAILKLVSLILMFIDILLIVLTRGSTVAAVFMYDQTNVIAWKAVNTSIASAAVMLVSIILLVIAAFQDNKKGSECA